MVSQYFKKLRKARKPQGRGCGGLIEEAIQLRKQCLPYFQGRSKRGHKTYIWFLEKVQQHLGMVYRSDGKETDIDIEEHKPVVNLGEELQGTDQEQSEEAERTSDDEAGHSDSMTLDQIDFISFLEVLMALVQKAAAFWKQAADKDLTVGAAASLSTIFLCEADQFISLTSLLDEEGQENKKTQKGPRPWVTADSDGKKMSYPMLAKDYVDALDQAKDAGEARCNLAALPPKYIYYMNLIWPSMDVVPDLIRSVHVPYVFAMLFRGQSAFKLRCKGSLDLVSLADLPLTTIIGLYFCSLVFTEDVLLHSRLLCDARTTVCADLGECLDILPRMIRDKGITDKQANAFRATVASMKLWADACLEPISLGEIHVFARMHWTDWHGRLIAANSNLLQTFLYLCEKRRLETAVDKGATGPSGVGDNDDDGETLLGALLEDSRVAPFLLQDGRPQTVQKCIMALQSWCHIPTKDGVTLSGMSGSISRTMEEAEQRQKTVVRSCQQRNKIGPLSREILESRHEGLHIDMRARLRKWGDGADDDSALVRYLIWETAGPNCEQLERALRTTLQKLPAWVDIFVKNILAELYSKGRSKRKRKWHQEIRNNCDRGIRAVFKKDADIRCVTINAPLLEPAIIRVALDFPGCNESLKSALGFAICVKFESNVSWIDQLFEATMPGWKPIFEDFKIKQLSESHDVQVRSYIMCLMPLDDFEDLDKGGRPKKAQKLLQQDRSRQRNEAVGNLFKDFMNEARPVLEQTYGKKARACSVEPMVGMAI
ncbi:hypothetical protein FPRO04_12316 [Fusarium proliferatum]|nr:hypothetical protein FPRO04_12316 [Fusarium proliferatum]